MSNYQAKVSNTQKYEDSQGSHIVTTGKLLVLKKEESPLKLGYFTPCIISETEEIEYGDYFYSEVDNGISRAEKVMLEYIKKANKPSYKILVLPEHFSDKHLQAIVDENMKDGDKVLVKCYTDNTKWGSGPIKKIHLDQQNYITLFPAKQSVQQAIDSYISNKYLGDNSKYDGGELIIYHVEKAFEAGADWAAQNNYSINETETK